ncbi:MAG: hypothetical protein MMC33_002703 [Icmadophila ericetorum]|nr:hypothetical protein [Icmadophila ericetorum]
MEPIVPSKLCQCSESSIICAVSVLEAWNDRYLRKLRLWSDPLRNAAVEPSRLGCAKERKCCGFKPTINPGEWEPVEATAEPVTNKFLTVTWNEYNRAQISETIEEFEGAMRRRLITKTWTWNAVAPWNEELMNMSDDETSGERRSYCGWCDKIIPSKADVEAQKAIR